MEEASESLVSGAVLCGRYLLRSKLGGGGFGVAWRATDQETGGEVAVKVFLPSVALRDADRAQAAARFAAEVEFLRRLDHRNIVRPIGFGTDGGVHCLITELVRGATLADAMIARASERQEIRIDEVMAVITPLAEAVEHAHARGVVHRDLKPRNVMLFDAGGWLDIRVLDFGVARLLATKEADATTVGRLIGTMLYMSPEQFKTPHVTAASDQFALATMLFEMLTLRWAWARDGAGVPLPVEASLRSSESNGYGAVLHRICVGERPAVTAYRPDLPEAIDEVLARAWSVSPDERYGSASALLSAVRGALMPVVNDRTQVDEPGTALTLMKSALKVADPTLLLREGLLPTPVDAALLPTAIVAAPSAKPVPVWLGLSMATAVAIATTTVGLATVRALKTAGAEVSTDGGAAPVPLAVPSSSSPVLAVPAGTATPTVAVDRSPSSPHRRVTSPPRPRPSDPAALARAAAAPVPSSPSPATSPQMARVLALGAALARKSDDELSKNQDLVPFLDAAEAVAAAEPEPLKTQLRRLILAAESQANNGRPDGIKAFLDRLEKRRVDGP